jgi:hypothetical protein
MPRSLCVLSLLLFDYFPDDNFRITAFTSDIAVSPFAGFY